MADDTNQGGIAVTIPEKGGLRESMHARMHADSTLTIDLSAIGRNASRFRRLAGARTRLCGVIKADAYGLGAHAVAPVLEAARWDMLAVHRIDEALTLLDHVRVPILVLGPVHGLSPMHPLAAPLAEGRVQLVVQDGASIDDAIALGQTMGRRIPVHLEIDTAMGRGVPLDTAANLLRGMLADPRLDTAGVMTHFTTSADADCTQAQYARFDNLLLPMRRRLPLTCRRHAAATTATLRDPGTRADMVRIGLGWVGHAVGIDAPSIDGEPLEGAVTWTARIASVRDVPAQTSLGYGGRFTCRTDTRIAMLPVGYADGLPTQATGHAVRVLDDDGVCVGAVPIIGTVAMDQVLLDVSALPTATVRRGTTVELFGPDSLPTVASDMGLQPHHLLTSIGPRVHRRLIDAVDALPTPATAAG